MCCNHKRSAFCMPASKQAVALARQPATVLCHDCTFLLCSWCMPPFLLLATTRVCLSRRKSEGMKAKAKQTAAEVETPPPVPVEAAVRAYVSALQRLLQVRAQGTSWWALAQLVRAKVGRLPASIVYKSLLIVAEALISSPAVSAASGAGADWHVWGRTWAIGSAAPAMAGPRGAQQAAGACYLPVSCPSLMHGFIDELMYKNAAIAAACAWSEGISLQCIVLCLLHLPCPTCPLLFLLLAASWRHWQCQAAALLRAARTRKSVGEAYRVAVTACLSI